MEVKIGDKFGKLEIISNKFIGYKYNTRVGMIKVRCECGTEKEMILCNLLTRNIQSCGKCNSVIGKIKHSLSGTRQWYIYKHMKDRCYNKNDKLYKNYGGRGVKICDEWLGKNGFINWWEWAKLNGYSDNLTIERIDVNGNYCPKNCTWVTIKEQARNKTNTVYLTAFGETKNLFDWIKDPRCKVGYNALKGRKYRGYTDEEAITIEYNKGKNK